MMLARVSSIPVLMVAHYAVLTGSVDTKLIWCLFTRKCRKWRKLLKSDKNWRSGIRVREILSVLLFYQFGLEVDCDQGVHD